jgi:hypothetical protein
VIAVAIVLTSTIAQGAAPTLTRLYPAGGQRGTSFQVTCGGEFEWPVSVWAPGIEVAVGEESGKLNITVPADLATDRVWLRLYNAEGASEVLPFLIGNLSEVTEEEENDSPDSPQLLPQGRMTVNGVLAERGDVDGFAVSLTAGMTLVADVDAHDKLGSPMDSILQIVSSDGFVLAENHDDVGLDPRIAFDVPADGTYIVRVFAFPSEPDSSVNFRGDDRYVYRLTLTDGPFISHAIPSAVSLVNPGDVEVFGWNIPAGTRLPVALLDAALTDQCGEIENHGDQRTIAGDGVGIVSHTDFANTLRVRTVPHEVVTVLATASKEQPLVLQVPTAITGQFSARQQVDHFDLPLSAGQSLVVAAESQGIELPVQPLMQLFDPTGSQAAEFREPKPQDAVITHTTAHDGVYRLTVEDRFDQHGDRCCYRLMVRVAEPDFALNLETDSIVVKPGESSEVVVNVQRRNTSAGSIGPITIEAVDLPAGVTAAAVISETEGDSSEKVTLSFSTEGTEFSGPIRILGRTSEPRQIERFASSPAQFDASLSAIWLTALVGEAAADSPPPE